MFRNRRWSWLDSGAAFMPGWSALGRAVSAAAFAALLPGLAGAQTAAISGAVTNAATGLPVSGVALHLSTASGLVGTTTTGAGGTYSFFPSPGTYFLHTSNSVGFLDEFHADLPCPVPPGCSDSVATGSTPIVLQLGQIQTVNFALQPGGVVTGKVLAAATGAPLANVNVSATSQSGLSFGTVTTDAAGSYRIDKLPTGSYVVSTFAEDAFIDEVYDNVPCIGECRRNLGAAPTLQVTAGTTTSGIDFRLAAGGRITGVVTDASTGAPVKDVVLEAWVHLANTFETIGPVVTDASGAYVIEGLAGATYFVGTTATPGYVNEVFDDIQCLGRCSPFLGGSGVPVVAGATSAARNFALARGASISGTVRNAATMAPIAAVVDVYTRVGQRSELVSSRGTDGAGVYTVPGLPTGTYFLATSNSSGFIDEIFPNRPCPGACDLEDVSALGQPITATDGATTAGHDFALAAGGQISGTVTDAATGLPIQGIAVRVFTHVGGVFRETQGISTNASGLFQFSGLPGGTYHLATSNSGSYVDEVFGGAACFGSCRDEFVLANGSPVVVTTGGISPGRNFALAIGGGISGRVRDAVTQIGLGSVGVRVYANIGGVPTQVAFDFTDFFGRYSVSRLQPAQYYAVSFANSATNYVNEIHSDIPCPGVTFCDPAAIIATGTPVTIGPVLGSAGVGTVDFGLLRRQEPPGPPVALRATTAGFRVDFSWGIATSGGAATSYVLEAGGTPGTTAITLAAPSTSLVVPAAPPGRFFVRVRGVNAFGIGPPSAEFELVIAGNGTSPPTEPRSVTAWMTGSRLNLSWFPGAPGGSPAIGYLVEAGTASGLSNIARVPVSEQFFSHVPVPNGFYFLRVRAFNGAGTSPPSDEVLLKVGGGPAPPEAPFFETPEVSGSTVSLAWRAPSVGTVTSYVLEAGTAPGLANILTFNTGNSATAISFAGVPRGTYFVRVRAANAVGVSIVSNEATVVVP